MTQKKNKQDVCRREFHTPGGDLHLRESDGRGRTITGYAILFNVPSVPLWTDEESEAREVIAPEAITKELLDGCDIKFTMFHDRQLILARSNSGTGTLSYSVDEKGVKFEFDAPATTDGDKAVELVRRGDISGCSFAFTTRYWDRDFVERSEVMVNGKIMITYRVKAITGVYDFALAADPAYPDTSVEAREMKQAFEEESGRRVPPVAKSAEVISQIREMRKQSALRPM